MKIFIPTFRRVARQHTFHALSPLLRKSVVFVIYKEEEKQFHELYPNTELLVCPARVRGVGRKRQFIVDTAGDECFVMMDDDLSFASRRLDDPSKFQEATAQDLHAMMARMRALLRTHAHVGILAREGGNRVMQDTVYAVRMMRVLAYNGRMLRAAGGVDFTRLPFMTDFDVTLQLLRKGLPNAVIAEFVQDQRGGSNATGGCSEYRTLTDQGESAIALKNLHSDFVKLVLKTTKGAWGGGTRTDVQISWKKALRSGQ